MVDISTALDQLSRLKRNNQYTLTVSNLMASISVLSVTGKEILNQPWRYEVIVTSPHKNIMIESILSQKATLTFNPASIFNMSKRISSLDNPLQTRILHGVVREFSQIAFNKDETHYKVVLEPRLYLNLGCRCSTYIVIVLFIRIKASLQSLKRCCVSMISQA